ncbi:MAG: hypothetical protein IPN33_25055 [Saprospiraceae bacterium]|nr:hypothetical protein [Saprospiraceae bacterium]
MQTKKSFWQSANFWFGLIAIAAALFGIRFPEDSLKQVAAGLIAIFSAGNIAFHYFKSLQGSELLDQLKRSLKSPQFYASILAFLVGFLPWLPIPQIQGLIDAILSGDTSLMLQAGFALLMVIIKLISPGTVKKDIS